jgi:hypothetical protein
MTQILFRCRFKKEAIFILHTNYIVSARLLKVRANPILDKMPDFQSTGTWTNWILNSIHVFLIPWGNRIRFIYLTFDRRTNINLTNVTKSSIKVHYALYINVSGSRRIP